MDDHIGKQRARVQRRAEAWSGIALGSAKRAASQAFSLVSQEGCAEAAAPLDGGISDIVSTGSSSDNGEEATCARDGATLEDALHRLRDAGGDVAPEAALRVALQVCRDLQLLHDGDGGDGSANGARRGAGGAQPQRADDMFSFGTLLLQLLQLLPQRAHNTRRQLLQVARACCARCPLSRPSAATVVRQLCVLSAASPSPSRGAAMLDVPRAPLHPRVSPLTSPEQRSPSLRDASAALHHGLRAPPRVDAHADPPPRPVSPPLTFPDKTAAPAALARVPSASSSASASDHDVATPPAEHRITPSTVVDQLSFATSVTPSLLHAAPPEYASSSMSSAISLRHKSSQLLDTPADTQSAQCPQHSVSSSPRRPPSPKPTPDPLDSRPHHDADHSRQIEKDALGVIAAAIADGHYSLVLSTLRTQHNSHAVAVVACTFLESVCRDKRLYFDFCEEGGIEQFISAVLLFGKIDAALCTIFFHAISALSSHHDDRVSHRLRGMGVPSVVIDMLAHYRTDTAIQSAGCECLALMARSSQQSQTAIATLGGPGIVYRAITQNNCSFRDVKLARASLRAVRYIAANNEKAAEYLVQVAALDPVSSAAELFTEAGLEQDILDAMEAFSFYANGRRSIIMSSGMNALATIMLRNREPRFLVQCCNFIRAIARWNDSECESAVLQSAISERVVALMEMSNNIVGMEGARLGWYACYACTFLASFGSRTRQRLLRIGAIEGAIDVLKRRKDDAKVVHIATDALAELMKNEPAAKNLAMDYKIVGCLKEALVLHRRMGRVAKALQWTLEYLAAPEGTAFAPAHGSHIFQDLSRENSSRTDSHRNQHKSQSWKSRLSFIRSNWKKS